MHAFDSNFQELSQSKARVEALTQAHIETQAKLDATLQQQQVLTNNHQVATEWQSKCKALEDSIMVMASEILGLEINIKHILLWCVQSYCLLILFFV